MMASFFVLFFTVAVGRTRGAVAADSSSGSYDGVVAVMIVMARWYCSVSRDEPIAARGDAALRCVALGAVAYRPIPSCLHEMIAQLAFGKYAQL